MTGLHTCLKPSSPAFSCSGDEHQSPPQWSPSEQGSLERILPSWNWMWCSPLKLCSTTASLSVCSVQKCQWYSFTLVSIAGPVCPTQTSPGDAADVMSQSVVVLQASKEAAIEGHINVKQNSTNSTSSTMRHTYWIFCKHIFLYSEVRSIQWKCKPLLNNSFE